MADLVFKSIKESRGDRFFVEYTPPFEGNTFASLSLVYAAESPIAQIRNDLKQEAMRWIHRYDFPLVASAWSDDDALVDVSSGQDQNHVLAWNENGQSRILWGRLAEFRIPEAASDQASLRRIFADVPHTTAAERREQVNKEARQTRTGLRVIVAFLVFRRAVVPAAVALAFYLHPLLGFIGLLGALADALHGGLRVLGYLPKSRKEREDEERMRRLEHFDYHCTRNPEGFERLKAENFAREARERTQQEAERLRSAMPTEGRNKGG